MTAVTALRYPWCIVIGSIVASAVTVRRDRPRAVACLVGPPLALALCELVVKPAVGRTLGGSLTYPSGSTVGAAALGAAVVLATPERLRAVAVPVVAVYSLGMAVAVVALRWHFPIDAVAGLAWGVGVVLVADASAWWAARRWAGRSGACAGRRPRADHTLRRVSARRGSGSPAAAGIQRGINRGRWVRCPGPPTGCG